MKHRAQTLSGEWITGWYVGIPCSDGTFESHSITTKENYRFTIKPETLSIETLKLDSNGDMIFGSFPLDGVMTKGGDVVRCAGRNFSVIYDSKTSSFRLLCRRDGVSTFGASEFFSSLTIFGKQSEVISEHL